LQNLPCGGRELKAKKKVRGKVRPIGRPKESEREGKVQRIVTLLNPDSVEHQAFIQTLRRYADTKRWSVSSTFLYCAEVGLAEILAGKVDTPIDRIKASADMTASKSAFDVGRLYEESPLAKATIKKPKVRKTRAKAKKPKMKEGKRNKEAT